MLSDRITSRAIGLAALLTVFACNDIKESVEINGTQMVLTAYQEGSPDVKTAVENGGTQVFWEPGDEIKVFSGSRTGRFSSGAGTLESVTTFTGHLEGTGPGADDIWAVYPYSDEASLDGESITTVIPSVQVARPGTFAQGANVAIAHSNTSTLQFYNVGGGLRFTLTEEGVSKVIFEGLGGEVLAGTVKIGFEDGLPKVQSVTGGSIFITLTPPDGEYFATDTWYYMTAIPCALEKGFKMRLFKNDTCAKVVSEKGCQIKRKIFGSLSKMDAGVKFEDIVSSLPETIEEIGESLDLLSTIESQINIIDAVISESGNNTAERLAEEYSNIDGVAYATATDEGNIAIVQRDGLVLNVFRNTDFVSDSFPSAPQLGTSGASLYGKNRARLTTRNTVKSYGRDFPFIVNKGRKALILAPYRWEFARQFKETLAPFFDNTPVVVEDVNADITKFKGVFLSQFDFIFIYAHGGTGYYAVNKEPFLNEDKDYLKSIDNVFIMATSSIGTRKDILYYIENGILNWEDIALAKLSEDDREFHICMTPSLLKGASLDNAFVVLNSCSSAAPEIWSGPGSLKEAFFNAGAAYFSGYETDVEPIRAEFIFEHAINFMAHGVSYKDAFEYWANSETLYANSIAQMHFLIDQDEEWHRKTANMSREESLNDAEIVLFAPWKYDVNPKNKDTQGFLFDPRPILEKPEPDGTTVNIVWSCDLHSFIEKAQYVEYSERQWTVNEKRDYLQTVSFDIYVGDSCIKTVDNPYRSTSFSIMLPDDYTCKIIARLTLDNGQEILYESNEEHFIIKPSTQDEPSYPTPEAVDLGLSVKWASFNLGASKPEEYGDYFAWGETEPKSEYLWDNYKWSNGNENALNKYNTDSSYGAVDNKLSFYEYGFSDDPAHKQLGDNWYTPSYSDWAELTSTRNCVWTWTNDYQGTGIKGYIVTSKKTQYAGNELFLPLVKSQGSYDTRSFYWYDCLYSEDDPASATCLVFYNGSIGLTASARCYGLTVRPVYKNIVQVESVVISDDYGRSNIDLKVGDGITLYSVVYPLNSTFKDVFWTSSNPAVATVSKDGVVHAQATGQTIISVTSRDGRKTDSCTLTVHEYPLPDAIDLGLPSGVKWASANLGASKPEEYGDYFAWGETEPKTDYSWSSYKWSNGAYKMLIKYCPTNKTDFWGGSGSPDNKTELVLEDDAARACLDGNWRTPRDAEWTELRNNCTWIWTNDYNGTGVSGIIATSKKDGFTDKSIFFPAAGSMNGTYVSYAVYSGYYWSSSLYTGYPDSAWTVYFNSGSSSPGRGNSSRYEGRSIRPVSY